MNQKQAQNAEDKDAEDFLVLPHEELAKKAARLASELAQVRCDCCKGSGLRVDIIRYGMCGACKFG